MENKDRKSRRARRSFTSEFKAEIVELCRQGDRSIGEIARDFDLTETAVREWVKQADVDAGSVEVQVAVDHGDDLLQLDAQLVEELSELDAARLVELVDELVAESDAGVDQDLPVGVLDEKPVDGDSTYRAPPRDGRREA